MNFPHPAARKRRGLTTSASTMRRNNHGCNMNAQPATTQIYATTAGTNRHAESAQRTAIKIGFATSNNRPPKARGERSSSKSHTTAQKTKIARYGISGLTPEKRPSEAW